jgi:Ser/Thr protein kinase RdoA (MazF antagonist)
MPDLAVADDILGALLDAQYALRVRSLELLAQADAKRVWRVVTDDGAAIIVRGSARPAAEAVARAQGAVLTALDRCRFPTERLRLTRAGAVSASAGGWTLLVTNPIGGRPTGDSAAELRSLGARLGQLHTFTPVTLGVAGTIGAAAMLPAREIAWVSGELARVAPHLDASQRARHDWFCAALAALDRCDDLPRVLLHNDCHPGNAITMPNGEVALIDWEGAGFGPAIIDFGFLLSSCDTPAVPAAPDPRRVAAVVAGYRHYRRPTRQELERLPAAIRFRALIFGAASFAARPGGTEESAWWRARYDAAAELAGRARDLFDR